MNEVRLSGHVAAPITVRRDRTNGLVIARTWIAIPRGKAGTDYVPITLPHREAVSASGVLHEGSMVSVTAHLHSALVPTGDGRVTGTRRVLYVIVDRYTYHATASAPEGERS